MTFLFCSLRREQLTPCNRVKKLTRQQHDLALYYPPDKDAQARPGPYRCSIKKESRSRLFVEQPLAGEAVLAEKMADV